MEKIFQNYFNCIAFLEIKAKLLLKLLQFIKSADIYTVLRDRFGQFLQSHTVNSSDRAEFI